MAVAFQHISSDVIQTNLRTTGHNYLAKNVSAKALQITVQISTKREPVVYIFGRFLSSVKSHSKHRDNCSIRDDFCQNFENE